MTVAGEVAREAAWVVAQILYGPAHDVGSQGVERRDLHVVATTDGEGEAVALQAVFAVRPQYEIGGRAVGVGVHRIRPVQLPGRGEPYVVRVETGDPGDAC